MAIGNYYANYIYKKMLKQFEKIYYAYTVSKRRRRQYELRYDFIPLIKWMPNLCKWLGLGKVVRRNKRRKVKR